MSSTPRKRWAAVALVAGLVLGGAACSSDDGDGAAETTTTTTSRSFSVSTPAGDVSLSLDGDLPPSWPADFPLPEGAEPAGSGSLVGEDSGVRVGVFSTAQAADEVFAFYTSNTELQPSDPSNVGIRDSFVGSVSIAGDYEGSVTVAGRSDSTYIVVVLEGGTTGTTGGSSGTAGTGGTTTTNAA